MGCHYKRTFPFLQAKTARSGRDHLFTYLAVGLGCRKMQIVDSLQGPWWELVGPERLL